MRARFTDRGFTLLEMVLVIVVIGILGRLLTPVALGSLRANAAILDVGVTVDKARLASDRLAFEIRELSSTTITTASTSSLVFTRVDYIPAATARSVTVDQTQPSATGKCDAAVRLSYTNLPITPAYTPVLTDQVCSLAFAYFDQTGTTTAVLANIRYVDFTLTMQPNAGGQSYVQRTSVALRNH